jgi:hypothetical protein
MATYITSTPLKRPTSKKGVFETVPPDNPVELDEDEAQPLLDCKAIRKPDVIQASAATDS